MLYLQSVFYTIQTIIIFTEFKRFQSSIYTLCFVTNYIYVVNSSKLLLCAYYILGASELLEKNKIFKKMSNKSSES